MSEPSREIDPAASSTGALDERDGPRPADGSHATAAGRAAPATAEPGQYLTFVVGDDEYAVAVLQVREILEFSPLTHIPLTPPWIRGVLNLRGAVVPVVELGLRFGMPETEVTDRTCIVIVEVDLDGEISVMGIVVDAVSKVVELDRDTIEAPPAFGTRVRVDYLSGMGKMDGRLVPLLDANRVLSTDELMMTLDVSPADESGTKEAR